MSRSKLPSFVASTHDYQAYLGSHTAIVRPHLAYKYDLLKSDRFAFFRGTCYRFVQVFKVICKELFKNNPEVLAIIDWHCDNMNTWRDSWARMVLGCNDFDEAAWFVWLIDLVRQAVSIKLAGDAGHLKINFERACAILVHKYQESLQTGGNPIVLEERHHKLRKMFMSGIEDPRRFYENYRKSCSEIDEIPEGAETMLDARIPAKGSNTFLRRAGVGSLGRIRVVRDGIVEGGQLTYEVKATVPSCVYFVNGQTGGPILYNDIVDRAVRCADPLLEVTDGWTGRRLSPSCSKISLADLKKKKDEDLLIGAIGFETGNIHLGTPDAIKDILRSIERMPSTWLRDAAKAMYDYTELDFQEWSAHWNSKARRRFMEAA